MIDRLASVERRLLRMEVVLRGIAAHLGVRNLPPFLSPDDDFLAIKIGSLDLTVRSLNCLRCEGLVYIGDLVRKTENDLLRVPNMGRRSLGEIKGVLAEMGLRLGTEVPGWPPENIEERAARANAAVTLP